MEACNNLNNIQFIFSEGKANGDTNPRKLSHNIWYYEWCPCRDEIFYLADFLIIRGGHTAISQAIQFGKPFISIPIENHGEQISNSNKIEKLRNRDKNRFKINKCKNHRRIDKRNHFR